MVVEEVFTITERGVVAIGKVKRGAVKARDELQIIGNPNDLRRVTVGELQMAANEREAIAGDNVGLRLMGVDWIDISRGMILTEVGSILPYTHFNALIYVMTSEEGGVNTPVSNRKDFAVCFDLDNLDANLSFEEGKNQVMPGDKDYVEISLVAPIAMEEGFHFSISKDRRNVGVGVVTRIIPKF